MNEIKEIRICASCHSITDSESANYCAECDNEGNTFIYICKESLLRYLDKKVIMIPNYSDGENHLQFLERYREFLKKEILGGS